jgi:hypothetical protein
MSERGIKITVNEFIEQLDPSVGEELAWSGAKHISELQGTKLGSDLFMETYGSFASALNYSSRYKVFLAVVALTTVEGLVESGIVKLEPEWDELVCKNHILNLANVHYASLSYILVSTKALEGVLLVSDDLYKDAEGPSMEFCFKPL